MLAAGATLRLAALKSRARSITRARAGAPLLSPHPFAVASRAPRAQSSLAQQMPGVAPREALAALRRSRAVCFDVDSTVITVEAIDEFAAFAGKKDAVAALTARAMGGSLPFRDALAARLSIIEPTQALLDAFLVEHAFHLTPGVEDFMKELRQRGADIFLVSGGFTQMIFPVADRLGIDRSKVFANTILFNECVASRRREPSFSYGRR